MADGRDSEERRNEFVNAAEKLFRENGIVDTTINSIVKEMDVAKGLFYYYFKSKDDVIEAISDKYNEIFNEMIYDSLEQENWDDTMKKFLHNSVTSFRELESRFHDDVDLSLISSRSIEEAKNVAVNMLIDLLNDGIKAGEITMEHTDYYAAILVSGIVQLMEQTEATDEEIEFIIFDLIERAGKD